MGYKFFCGGFGKPIPSAARTGPVLDRPGLVLILTKEYREGLLPRAGLLTELRPEKETDP